MCFELQYPLSMDIGWLVCILRGLNERGVFTLCRGVSTRYREFSTSGSLMKAARMLRWTQNGRYARHGRESECRAWVWSRGR